MNVHAPVEASSPDPVDLYVGGRVRLARKAINMSQTALAEALKLTFQQVQKYERGFNRISASRLHHIAEALGRPIPWFFEGLGTHVPGTPDPDAPLLAALHDDDIRQMVMAAASLPPATRRTLRISACAIAGDIGSLKEARAIAGKVAAGLAEADA